ncbi:MAG: glucose 1-dehydrogenase [Okeania sp. SIO3I5]|uniref:glucose 1-dehydrogenase n=1 Tax=Okeania sp. SIO3I5 TaxID=2607805 RepID=UPI0013BA337A|nr:glucose 1-dehydrogenase [Okeania sp. SIO3I5]NEQ40547.1 glucose 1-dehydrogenase [Okeania sp. SIO3I5]
MSLSKEFDGKVALVTGGSSGIGKATALAFALAGAKVVIASRRVDIGEQAVQEICTRGGDAIFIKTDVSQADEVRALVDKTVDIYGRLDCALNNAGGAAKMGSLINTSEEDFERDINTHLKGTWLCLKYEIPRMLEQKTGTIVNIASMAGVIGCINASAYSASKGGVIALSRAIATEYAKSGIRVNVISPGVIQTPLLDKLRKEAEEFSKGSPNVLAFSGIPRDISEAVLYLCSDRASFITGQNLIIDGGYTIQ